MPRNTPRFSMGISPMVIMSTNHVDIIHETFIYQHYYNSIMICRFSKKKGFCNYCYLAPDALECDGLLESRHRCPLWRKP